DRWLCHSGPRVQGHEDAGADGQQPSHHPEPEGAQGRGRIRPAADQRRRARPEGRLGAGEEPSEGWCVMSAKLDVRTPDGKTNGSVDLPTEICDVQANIPLMHQVVVAQLAAGRQGTHSTKTRAEV